MGQNMTRGEIQDLLAKFATDNPKYRDALVRDPKSNREALGTRWATSR